MDMDERQAQHSSCVQERRFVCPLTKKIMTDAVRIESTGKSYERQALHQWIERNGRICPVSGMAFRAKDVETNFGLQWEILYWQRQSSSSSTICCGDDQASTTSLSSTSISCHQSLPPPPPAAPVDSPPVRPKRRGSGNAACASATLAGPSEHSKRFTACKEACPSDTFMRPPRRIPSFLTLMNLDAVDCTEDLAQYDENMSNDSGDLTMDRLISVLDAAISLTEDS